MLALIYDRHFLKYEIGALNLIHGYGKTAWSCFESIKDTSFSQKQLCMWLEMLTCMCRGDTLMEENRKNYRALLSILPQIILLYARSVEICQEIKGITSFECEFLDLEHEFLVILYECLKTLQYVTLLQPVELDLEVLYERVNCLAVKCKRSCRGYFGMEDNSRRSLIA
jgi:hypothetical protein